MFTKENIKTVLLELHEKIYNVSYLIGAYTLRKILSIANLIKNFFLFILKFLKKGLLRLVRFLLRIAFILAQEISHPFKSLAHFIGEVKKEVDKSKVNGEKQSAFSVFKKLLKSSRRAVSSNLLVILSYFSPMFAVLVLTLTVSAYGVDNYAVKIKYGDNVLGICENEAVFFEGQKMAQDRVVYSSDSDIVYFQPQFEVTSLKSGDKTLDAYEVCDMLIRYTDDFVEATGLYINDELIAVTQNGISLRKELDDILSSAWSGDKNETVDFYEKVELRDGAYPENSVISTDEMKQLLNSNKSEKQVYIVESGDSIWSIAEKNNITRSELRALNPDIENGIFVGDEVLINASVPTIKIKTMVTESEEVEVPYQTISTSSPNYSYGYKRTVVSGKNGVASQSVQKTYVDGVLTDEEVLSSVVIKKPVTEQLVVGTYISSTLAASTGTGEYSGQFIWPVKGGGYITCSITGYRGHTGIDIGGVNYGTPILAAADGVVIKAYKGWTGYGHHVIIDHGNGVQTLYAHCNKLYVTAGQTVKQGDKIGGLGETGNAQGKHLHFEIRMNGKYMNAANFIGSYYGQKVTNKIK